MIGGVLLFSLFLKINLLPFIQIVLTPKNKHIGNTPGHSEYIKDISQSCLQWKYGKGKKFLLSPGSFSISSLERDHLLCHAASRRGEYYITIAWLEGAKGHKIALLLSSKEGEEVFSQGAISKRNFTIVSLALSPWLLGLLQNSLDKISDKNPWSPRVSGYYDLRCSIHCFQN